MVAIYALRDPRDHAIRYIGKAEDTKKRLASHLRDARRRDTPVYRWIRKLQAAGLTPSIDVLMECRAEEWPACEREFITQAKACGIRLLNVAEGGDAPMCPAHVRSENGYRLNEKLRADPIARKYRDNMRALANYLRSGKASEKLKATLLSRPDVFGGLYHLL